MSPKLERKRSFFERHLPWFFGALVGALTFTAAALIVDFGVLAEYEAFPSIVRGYTPLGLALGVVSIGLCAVSFFYSLRKRALQERLVVLRGTMTAWLWAHVYFGVLAIVAALAHAGYGLWTAQLTTGKALLLLLVLVVASGLLWRVLYGTVPPAAAQNVGNYSELASRTRASALLVEIEKLAAGRSQRFQELERWLLDATPSDAELAQAAASLGPDEQRALYEVAGLARERQAALSREKRQAGYRRLLQGWRILHVPLSLAFLALIPVHVLWALDVPARAVPLGAVDGVHFGGFESASACEPCHRNVVEQWRTSMHAHAMTSPVMIAQANQVARSTLERASSPDPAKICVNCHGPIGAALTEQSTLPLSGSLRISADDAFLNEGISCAVCHQWQGEPRTGGAGLSDFKHGLVPGREYFGPIATPVGNAFHRSSASPLFANPDQLCRNCHAVTYDRDGDGRVQRGTDLVLQTLFDEWEDYAKAGGTTCTACHMPASTETRAAASAEIPFEQDQDAPARRLRSHAFVGVDYPIDVPEIRERTRPAREALLKSAATVTLVPGSTRLRDGALSFAVEVANTGAGHNLPGGFAFVRQMWLEIVVRDPDGRELASSGKLADPTQDLCDANILDDAESPLRPFLSGCSSSDPLLVNFQQMLVDRVEPARDAAKRPLLDARGQPKLARVAGASEVVLQHLTGGSVPRIRPHTRTPIPTLAPAEKAVFPYGVSLPAGSRPAKLSVRLLFRTMPPYFLRALAAGQRPGDGPDLRPFVANLEIIEMVRLDTELTDL